MAIVFIINQNWQNIVSILMQSRMGPPGHRPLSNKKKIIKIGPYAAELCGDKHKKKYIRVESITSSFLKSVKNGNKWHVCWWRYGWENVAVRLPIYGAFGCSKYFIGPGSGLFHSSFRIHSTCCCTHSLCFHCVRSIGLKLKNDKRVNKKCSCSIF